MTPAQLFTMLAATMGVGMAARESPWVSADWWTCHCGSVLDIGARGLRGRPIKTVLLATGWRVVDDKPVCAVCARREAT